MSQPAINQRDLRLRSKQIMDSVEDGFGFTVTRDGHEIGELIPLHARRTFVSRELFLAGASRLPPIDVDRFRADLDAVFDNRLGDPYGR